MSRIFANPSALRSMIGFHLGVAPDDLDTRSVAAAERVLGSTYGLVRDCAELPALADGPRLSTFVARGPLRVPGTAFCAPPVGTGVAAEPRAAWLAAVGEAVESYCSMAPFDPGLVVRAPFVEIEEAAVHPGRFASLSARQRAGSESPPPLTITRDIDWRWAYSLTTDRPVLVPAAFVGHGALGSPNNFLPERLSTGLACHVSLVHAVLGGLCEVMERDALAIAWHHRMPVVPLDVAGSATADLLEERLSGCGMQFGLYGVPTDLPFPVVLAVAWASPVVPGAAVGAACRPSAEDAAAKALTEACQVLSGFAEGTPPVPPRQVRTLDDHADLYASRHGGALLRRHLIVDRASTPLGGLSFTATSTNIALQVAVEALAELGLEVVVADLSSSDAAAAGFRVVRMIVPGAVDINADARFPQLGARRLYDVPVRLGLRTSPLVERRLNLLPVPLA